MLHRKCHFKCPECGGPVKADEDGCCSLCGADCIIAPGFDVVGVQYLVELYPGESWLAPWSGDPGRTLKRTSAQKYKNIHAATCALARAKKMYGYRDYTKARVVEA